MLKKLISKLVAKHGLLPLIIIIGDMAVDITKTKKDDEIWAKVKELVEKLKDE